MDKKQSLFGYSFRSAQLLVSTAIGGTSLAALFARWLGLELPEFPSTLIGMYESIRSALFIWTNWLPFSWPEWLSDAIFLYFVSGFAIARAELFDALNSGAQKKFSTVLFSAVMWPRTFYQFWFNRPSKRQRKEEALAYQVASEENKQKLRTLAKMERRLFWIVHGVFILTFIFAIVLLKWESIKALT